MKSLLQNTIFLHYDLIKSIVAAIKNYIFHHYPTLHTFQMTVKSCCPGWPIPTSFQCHIILIYIFYIKVNTVSKLVYIHILSLFFRVCYQFSLTRTIEKRVDENKENCKQQKPRAFLITFRGKYLCTKVPLTI